MTPSSNRTACCLPASELSFLAMHQTRPYHHSPFEFRGVPALDERFVSVEGFCKRRGAPQTWMSAGSASRSGRGSRNHIMSLSTNRMCTPVSSAACARLYAPFRTESTALYFFNKTAFGHYHASQIYSSCSTSACTNLIHSHQKGRHQAARTIQGAQLVLAADIRVRLLHKRFADTVEATEELHAGPPAGAPACPSRSAGKRGPSDCGPCRAPPPAPPAAPCGNP